MKNNYNRLFVLIFLFFSISLKAKEGLDHQFKLNGKITFKSPKKPYPDLGLYGAKLQLWFLDKKGKVIIPDKLYLYQDKLTTTVKEDGSFSFDFSMFLNLYNCHQLAIEILPTSDAGKIHYDQSQYITKTSLGKINLISDVKNGRAVSIPFNSEAYIHQHTYQIEVSNRLGNHLRALSLAREFALIILARMGESPNIPPIDVHFHEFGDGETNGEYYIPTAIKDNYIDIEVTKVASSTKIIYHEYAHYFHYKLVEASCTKTEWHQTSEAYKEGFAEFFGMAARSYAAATYKENNVFAQTGDHENTPFLPIPFSKGSYAKKNPAVLKFASYLWSIYDGPTQPYVDTAYVGMDNDDVDGYKYGLDTKIFKMIKQIGAGYDIFPDYFHVKLLENLPKDLAIAIGKIRSFMLVYDGNIDFAMRPVPIKSVMLSTALYGHMTLTIKLQHYPNTYSNINQPLNDNKRILNNFKIYKKVDNEWQFFNLYHAIPSEQNGVAYATLDDNFGSTQMDYKITPFNNTGESLEPVEFSYKPMVVSITGDKEVDAAVEGSWKAIIQYNNGGLPNYAYRWYIKPEGGNQYVFVGEKNNGNFKYLAPQGKNFHLKVEVEDAQGIKVVSTPIFVKTIVKKLEATIQGPTSTYAYEQGTWNVTIKGGVPPYKLVWGTKISNNYSNIYQGETYHTKAGENFLVLVGVTDAKGVTVNQQLAVKVLPMEVAIAGDKLAYLHKLAHWQPILKGGEGPFNVMWGMKKEEENLFWPVDASYFHAKQFDQEGVYYLRLWIEDKNGVSAQSADFKVNVLYQPPYVVIKAPDAINAGENPVIHHTLEGGKGPFEYSWQLFNKNNEFIKQMGYSEATVLKTFFNMQGLYFVKLTVKDLYNNQVAYAQHGITILAKDIIISPYQDETWRVSPNPARNQVEVRYTLREISQVITKVYDSQGNLIAELPSTIGNIGENLLKLDVSRWKADTYLLKMTINSPKGIQLTTTRIVVE